MQDGIGCEENFEVVTRYLIEKLVIGKGFKDVDITLPSGECDSDPESHSPTDKTLEEVDGDSSLDLTNKVPIYGPNPIGFV
jgi:hypothetical protein